MNLTRLNEVSTAYSYAQIFMACQDKIKGWENFSQDELNSVGYTYFYLNGDKYVSPLVENLMNDFTGLELFDKYIRIFTTYCGNSFSSLYRAMFSDYNPIENYMMIENGEDTRELTDDTTDTHNKQNTNTITTDGETTVENSSTREIKKAGFNTTNPVVDTVETTNENDANINNETVEQSGNETLTGQSVKTVTESNKHNFTRSGNIGVTTSQQMIESEIELRKKEYWAIVFKKLNDLLTLSIY